MESIILLNVGDSAQIRPIQIQVFAEKLIIVYLRNNEKITSKSAMALLKLGSSRAREILSYMAEKDIIIKNGKTNGTYYTLRQGR